MTANDADFDAILAGLQADPGAHAYVQINFTITHELYQDYVTPDRIADFRRRFPEHAGPWSAAEVAQTLDFFEANRHTLQLNHPEAVRTLGLEEADVERIDGVLRLAYAACVEQLDEYFGRFVERIRAAGLYDESLIAFTSDHGETFHHEGQPFHWMHGLQLVPSVMQVPLIVRGPALGIEPGRHARVTRSIDVFPTLAGLCDLRLRDDAPVSGEDLSPSLLGRSEAPQLLAFMHTSTLGPERVKRYRREGHAVATGFLPEATPEHMWVAVRDDDLLFEYRAVEPGRWATRAYDLARDPHAQQDLFDEQQASHREARDKLLAYRQHLADAFARIDPDGGLSQKQILDRLQSLGYVGDED